MKLNTHYHLKGRALKTALAVFLAELFAVILGRSSSFYSSMAAVICMMKNHEMTQQKGIERYTLEVRVSNQAAIHLYEKLGFASVGIRKNFYSKPAEDAMIMWTQE